MRDTSPRWSRVRCIRCLVGPGTPCRSLNGKPHVCRVIDGGRAAQDVRNAKRGHVAVSPDGYTAIKAEATARGVSMGRVVEDRIARLAGGKGAA